MAEKLYFPKTFFFFFSNGGYHKNFFYLTGFVTKIWVSILGTSSQIWVIILYNAFTWERRKKTPENIVYNTLSTGINFIWMSRIVITDHWLQYCHEWQFQMCLDNFCSQCFWFHWVFDFVFVFCTLSGCIGIYIRVHVLRYSEVNVNFKLFQRNPGPRLSSIFILTDSNFKITCLPALVGLVFYRAS